MSQSFNHSGGLGGNDAMESRSGDSSDLIARSGDDSKERVRACWNSSFSAEHAETPRVSAEQALCAEESLENGGGLCAPFWKGSQ